MTHVTLRVVEAEGVDLVRGPQDDSGQGQRAADGQPQLKGEGLQGQMGQQGQVRQVRQSLLS